MGAVLELLADPRVISVVALGVALISLYRTGRLQRLQERLAGHQLRDYERAEVARLHADLRVTAEYRPDHIFIVNAGEASAHRIDLQFPDGNDPIVASEREEKLPIAMLLPDERFPLSAAFSMDNAPPFNAVLTWQDPDGSERTRQVVIVPQ